MSILLQLDPWQWDQTEYHMPQSLFGNRDCAEGQRLENSLHLGDPNSNVRQVFAGNLHRGVRGGVGQEMDFGERRVRK